MRPSVNSVVKYHRYWSCVIEVGTQNSLTCAIKLRTRTSEIETHSYDPINLQINAKLRSELSVENGTRKLGQRRNKSSQLTH